MRLAATQRKQFCNCSVRQRFTVALPPGQSKTIRCSENEIGSMLKRQTPGSVNKRLIRYLKITG